MPYPTLINGKTVADGIAMSCSNTNIVQPSLFYVGHEIRQTVYKGDKDYKAPMDLKVWANQGVLLINTALTTTVGKVGTHYKLWRPFLVFLLDMLHWHNGGLVYCFLGLKAKELSSLTGDNCYKLFAMHPAAAAHNQEERWNSGDLFNRVNLLLEKDGKTKIIW